MLCVAYSMYVRQTKIINSSVSLVFINNKETAGFPVKPAVCNKFSFTFSCQNTGSFH